MTREHKHKLEGLEREQALFFHISKIKEKLKRGTWLRRRPHGHKLVEIPLTLAKKKRLTESLDFLIKAVERDRDI